ncbi:MAG: hypothetical protein JNM70_00795 [Anaerolineae bacterium]|nr:hypothetical protein [Anaerolineae bacterium]
MMRSKLLVAGLLVALVVMPVQAQSSEYRLRQPSVYELAQRMLEIGRSTATLGSPPFFDPVTISEISALLFHDYEQLVQVPFTDLLALYDAMSIGDGVYPRDEWGQAIIHSWLNANQPDLSKGGQIGFADFRIEVIPRDFNSDGLNEYLLDVTKGGPVDRASCWYEAELVDYLIVQQKADQYQFIDHPVPFGTLPIGGSLSTYGKAHMMEIGFEDINADGLPEWLVLRGGERAGDPREGYINIGNLYVLAWRDGQMVDLADDSADGEYPRSLTDYNEDAGTCFSPHPRDIRWEFSNIDDDPALEIVQRQIYLDNWYCESVETKVLDWDATTDHYRLQATEKGFAAETRQCAQRQAEEAMWAGDYPQAIRLYRSGSALPAPVPSYLTDGNGETNDEWIQDAERTLASLDEYGLLRLALAYILTDQPEKARITLANLPDGAFISSAMKVFATLLRDHLESPARACLAAYNLFTTSYPNLLLGLTLEQKFFVDPEYAPERIGCDAPRIIEAVIAEHGFSAEETPLSFMESLGLPIFRTITADFDNDGDMDWLIWLDSLMPPFAVVHMDNGYRVSRPPIDPYRQAESLDVFRLPGEAGWGVVYFDQDYFRQEYLGFLDAPPWAFVYYRLGVGDPMISPFERCVGKDRFNPVKMTIWRVDDGAWWKIFSEGVCATNLSEAFPQGEGSVVLAGSETVYEDWYSGAEVRKNLNFVWDPNIKWYVIVVTEEVDPDPNPTPMPYDPPKYYWIWQAYEARDYAFIVENGAALINPQSSTAEERGWSYRYFRGLALEALDRPEEALAEYVALVENVPDSVWGQLAALHVEAAR